LRKIVACVILAMFVASALCTMSAKAYLAEADINSDGFVNSKDAVLLGFAFGSHPGQANWNEKADLDHNLVINAMDAVILGANFGASA